MLEKLDNIDVALTVKMELMVLLSKKNHSVMAEWLG